MKTPQEELFILCRKIAADIVGEKNTFDYLPPTAANYPFFFIGEQSSRDLINKSVVFVEVSQTVHLYTNDWKKRGTTSKLALQFIEKIREQLKTEHFYINIKNLRLRNIVDNSTKTQLLHSVIEVDFLMY